MLRAVLIVLALVIVAVLGATALGLLNFTQSPGADAPKFSVKVNDVDVGTTTANVQVPTVGTATRQVEVPTLQIDNGAAPAPAPANTQ
jgi:hypothetical protein